MVNENFVVKSALLNILARQESEKIIQLMAQKEPKKILERRFRVRKIWLLQTNIVKN